MKSFKMFIEQAPSTATTSVAGAGDDKIVPVHMNKRRKKNIEVLKRFISNREDSQKKWSR